ncbi:MAG: hypothetical protein EOP88_17525 [Verrucomicrobiaceae bacterium]|nr:MAG: hypothetical protein EOP88_17525 [Verrucomicrobiaceae bacterium]
MKERSVYKEWPIVHLVGPGLTCFFLYLAISSVSMTPVNGGPLLQIFLIVLCAGMAVACAFLYATGVARYELEEKGLRIHKLFRTTFHPWEDFWKIQQIAPLSVVIFRSRSGVISYASTNFFPQIGELINVILERSNCRLEGFRGEGE